MGMKGDDAGDGRMVPCLVAVRFVVAAAVGALAFAVMVMVIAKVRRPEEIQVAIDRGYITVLQPPPSPSPTTPLLPISVPATEDTGPRLHSNEINVNFGSASSSDDETVTSTTTTQDSSFDVGNNGDRESWSLPASAAAAAAEGPMQADQSQLHLHRLVVSLTTSYSNRRGREHSINCTNITVGLVDLRVRQSPSWLVSGKLPVGIRESMAKFGFQNNFTLFTESSHTEATTVDIADPYQDRYITRRIAEESVFQVLVIVHMLTHPLSDSDTTAAAAATKPNQSGQDHKKDLQHTFYCWPVTVGYGYKDLRTTQDVQCKTIGSSQVPDRHNWAPAPAKPPTAGHS
ncbi:uncharacterized protein LOC127777768 [Oryza glaberrima]|uniref:uncharacterized protein LOC127777768 n=1 Tax=Oryza glaberrima TaxID=4538 RepID=UPI00023E1BCA|nr:uncharacterized protein LOC127777768 [Oryza glaberrima]